MPQETRGPDEGEREAAFKEAFELRERGERGEAVAAFQRALALDPASAAGWLVLYELLSDLGRTGEAVEAARRAVELRPRNADVSNALVGALLDYSDATASMVEVRRFMAIWRQGLVRKFPIEIRDFYERAEGDNPEELLRDWRIARRPGGEG